MPSKKALMIASEAILGPLVPWDGEAYSVDIEDLGIATTTIQIKELDLPEGKFLQAYRIQANGPVTVYANCQ